MCSYLAVVVNVILFCPWEGCAYFSYCTYIYLSIFHILAYCICVGYILYVYIRTYGKLSLLLVQCMYVCEGITLVAKSLIIWLACYPLVCPPACLSPFFVVLLILSPAWSIWSCFTAQCCRSNKKDGKNKNEKKGKKWERKIECAEVSPSFYWIQSLNPFAPCAHSVEIAMKQFCSGSSH